MPERVYMNRIPGEERIHVEIPAAEIPALLEDLGGLYFHVNPVTAELIRILQETQHRFAAASSKEPT